MASGNYTYSRHIFLHHTSVLTRKSIYCNIRIMILEWKMYNTYIFTDQQCINGWPFSQYGTLSTILMNCLCAHSRVILSFFSPLPCNSGYKHHNNPPPLPRAHNQFCHSTKYIILYSSKANLMVNIIFEYRIRCLCCALGKRLVTRIISINNFCFHDHSTFVLNFADIWRMNLIWQFPISHMILDISIVTK